MNFFVPAEVKGRRIISFTWQTTALFSVTAIITAISPSLFFRVVAVTIALVLFGLGMIIFLVAYLRSIGRSRYEVISVAGVYLMMGGVAPAAVRRSMYAALAVLDFWLMRHYARLDPPEAGAEAEGGGAAPLPAPGY